VNDRYFVALGWIGLALAVAIDRCEQVAARARRCTMKTRLRWHDDMPEPDDIPLLYMGGYDHSAEDRAFNENLLPDFYKPPT